MFTTVVAVAAAFLGAASLILHAVAPRTSITWDDQLEAFVDEALSALHSAGMVPPAVPAAEPK